MSEEASMDVKLQCASCHRWVSSWHTIIVRVVLGDKVIAARTPAYLCGACYEEHEGELKED